MLTACLLSSFVKKIPSNCIIMWFDKKNIFVVNQTEKTLSTCIMMWFDEKKNLLRKSNHRKIRQIARWCVLTKKIFSFFTVGFLDIFFSWGPEGYIVRFHIFYSSFETSDCWRTPQKYGVWTLKRNPTWKRYVPLLLTKVKQLWFLSISKI